MMGNRSAKPSAVIRVESVELIRRWSYHKDDISQFSVQLSQTLAHKHYCKNCPLFMKAGHRYCGNSKHVTDGVHNSVGLN